MRVALQVTNRFGCPFRKPEDRECLGFFSVSSCEHPERAKRGGDLWCPDRPGSRSDDPDPENTPFPPKCPLRAGDEARQ